MSLLLAIDATQWVLFAVLLAVIIIFPIFAQLKNKKENSQFQQVLNSVKKGDKVMMSSGVIGKVVSLSEKDNFKTVTIETGDETHKGYMTFDMGAIYANLSAPSIQTAPVTEKAPEIKAEEIVEEIKETAEISNKSEFAVEEKVEQPKEKKTTKKSTAKTSKSKK